jgi:outer membrane receptor protein involved in Fe transport
MDVRGIEFQAVYEPSERLLLRGQYSYSDIDGISCYTSPVSVGEPCQEYRDLDYRSLKNTLGFLTSYRLDNGISLSSMVSYNSSKSSFFKGSKLDDFTRIDLKAAKNWQIGQSSIDISFTVQNVGDAYAEFTRNNIFKTRYIVGLKANFL